MCNEQQPDRDFSETAFLIKSAASDETHRLAMELKALLDAREHDRERGQDS